MRPPVLETLMLMLILHLPCCYAAMATPGEAGSAMRRRDVLKGATAAAALAQQPSVALARVPASAGPTNEVVGEIDGIRQKRLGGSGIIVSEVGLGTQRWGSTDFNAPDMAACHALMDRAILESGVNLIDTAEQYPIPSDDLTGRFEGYTEQIIGRWLAKDKARRQKVVLASKITGGDNVNKRNIVADCEGSLKRLGTDYLDVYMLHWPARYTPQSTPRAPLSLSLTLGLSRSRSRSLSLTPASSPSSYP